MQELEAVFLQFAVPEPSSVMHVAGRWLDRSDCTNAKARTPVAPSSQVVFHEIPSSCSGVLRGMDWLCWPHRVVAAQMPVLQYWFDDVAESTVPNHGVLGTAGNATVATGTTFGKPAGWPWDPMFLGSTLIVNDNTERVYTADINAIDSLHAFTLAFWVNPTSLEHLAGITWRLRTIAVEPGIKGWNLDGGQLQCQSASVAALGWFEQLC